MLFGEERIADGLRQVLEDTVREYEEQENVTVKFGKPLIGFVAADTPIYYRFMAAGFTHSKDLYTPGTTIVSFFIPYDPAVGIANRNGEGVAEEWLDAYGQSIMLRVKASGNLKRYIEECGREASIINSATDWSKETACPAWSNKLSAYAAGLGEFGPRGCIITKEGSWGVFGAIITELRLPTTAEWTSADAETVCRKIADATYMWNEEYEQPDGTAGSVAPDAIAACPCGAITQDGIDKFKCQEFCVGLGTYIPTPDACGKCYPEK